MDNSSPWAQLHVENGEGASESNNRQLASSEIPLNYRKLFAQSRPANGQVDRNQLEQLLARAGLSPQLLASVLAGLAPKVDEQEFYDSLSKAASLNNQVDTALQGSMDSGGDGPPQSAAQHEHLATCDTYELSGTRPIKVEIKPGMEGRWGFRHVVYIVSGAIQVNGAQTAVLVHRRYSDFVWLLDWLVKVYPFRALPLLPPKRVQINGHFLSGDTSQFLYRRRLGLSRFLNLLMIHPVLSKDRVVQAFLVKTQPIEIIRSDFDGKASEEFHDLTARPSFIADFDSKTYNEWLVGLQNSVEKSLIVVTAICKLLATQSRRLYAQAGDSCNTTMDFEALGSSLESLYPNNRDNLPQIARGVASMAKHHEQQHGAFLDAAAALQDGALEDIKYYRDVLLSVRELYKRHRLYGGDSVLQLKSRIDRAQSKIESLKGPNNTDQIEKLEQKIIEYREMIQFQINRGWLIKEVLTQELQMAQQSQYQLSRVIRNYGSYNYSMCESFKAISQSLYDDTSDLPLK